MDNGNVNFIEENSSNPAIQEHKPTGMTAFLMKKMKVSQKSATILLLVGVLLFFGLALVVFFVGYYVDTGVEEDLIERLER